MGLSNHFSLRNTSTLNLTSAFTMANQQKLKSFASHSGFDPTVLRISNLALDYASIQEHRLYCHDEPIDLFGNPAWATKDTRTNCFIVPEHGSFVNLVLGLLVCRSQLSNGGKNLESISGDTGSMIDLKESVYMTSMRRSF